MFLENQLSLCGFFVSETFNSVCFHVVSFFVSEPELTDSVQRRSSNFAFCVRKNLKLAEQTPNAGF